MYPKEDKQVGGGGGAQVLQGHNDLLLIVSLQP